MYSPLRAFHNPLLSKVEGAFKGGFYVGMGWAYCFTLAAALIHISASQRRVIFL